MLLHILLGVYPARQSIFAWLRPSEIINLCIATGLSLTDVEQKRYITPLRELFYSPQWTNDVVSKSGSFLLLGEDIRLLMDSRCTNLNIMIVVRTTSQSSNGTQQYSTNASTELGWACNECTPSYLYSDVCVISPTKNVLDIYNSSDRIKLHTVVTDRLRVSHGLFNSLAQVLESDMPMDVVRYLRTEYALCRKILCVPYTESCGSNSNTLLCSKISTLEVMLRRDYFTYCTCSMAYGCTVRVDFDYGELDVNLLPHNVRWFAYFDNHTCGNEMVHMSDFISEFF